MNCPVVNATERHREFVARLPPECAGLHEPQVMRIRRLARAEQTRLLGHGPKMLLIAIAARSAHREYALVDSTGLIPISGIRPSRSLQRRFRGFSNGSCSRIIRDWPGDFRRHDLG